MNNDIHSPKRLDDLERANALDWDAFRYVSGEMADDESHAFEQRLAAEQPAREAVATAVELGSVMALCAAEPVRTRRWRPMLLACVGIALSAGVALVWLSFQLVSDHGGNSNDVAHQEDRQRVADSPDTAELAMLWSETRDELAADEDAVDFWNIIPSDGDGSAGLEDGNPDEEVATPEWMLAGIKSLEASESESLMPDEMDEGEES